MISAMSVLVGIFGLTITAAGVLGCVRPSVLAGVIEPSWRTPKGLYLAVGVRLILGLAMLASAGDSRFPSAFRVIGIVSLVAAGVLSLLGFDRVRALVQWWLGRPTWVIRVWAVVALGFGVFMVYAVS